MILGLLPLLWASETVIPEVPPDPAPSSDVKTHVVALPNLSYDTDDGLGFGARMEITRVKPGVDPYLASYVFHFFGTLRGYHHHKFRFDLPHLPNNYRLTGYLAFRAWLHNGYWGVGNQQQRDPTTPDAYVYSLLQPYLRLTLSKRITGPWSLFGAVQGTWSRVTSEADSLLTEQQPYGMDGGFSLQTTLGARWDTRLPEVTPEKGGLVELAIRGAPPIPGGSGAFAGAFASVRYFWTLASRVTFGSRLMGEYLAGEVPFYEMNQWSGWIPVNGMGGSDTLRGIPSGRFIGPGKWVFNNELRIDVLEHSLFHRPVRWQVVPFADVGGVFGSPGDEFLPHPGVGGGIRAIFDTTMVARIDSACGWDLVDGKPAPNLGFYIMFDHMF